MMATRVEEVERLPGAGERVLRGVPTRWRLFPFLGPAFIACVAYMDPGNFATNIAGGSKFGFTLVWVIVASNLMAMLIQTLSAKLGIATGRNLPEVCRERFSRRTSIGLWLQAELIAMATDLAEFLGAAIGIKLLLGIPLFPAAVITGVITFLILALQRYGFRPLEAVITAFVAVIGVCYLGELWFAHPPLVTVAKHAVVPDFAGNESVLLAVGILGATVMPHVICLHSALTQQRIVPQNDEEAKTLYRYTRLDVLIAMSLAGLINIAMLVVAATVFFGSGLHNVESLDRADPRRRLERAVRAGPDGLRPLELDHRDTVRPGRDARIHPPPDPAVRAPDRDDDPRIRRDRHRARPLSDARDLPGRALVRHPVRPRPAGHVHQPPRRDGRARQSADDDRRGSRCCRADLGPEPLPARSDFRADRLRCVAAARPLHTSPSMPAGSLGPPGCEAHQPEHEQDDRDDPHDVDRLPEANRSEEDRKQQDHQNQPHGRLPSLISGSRGTRRFPDPVPKKQPAAPGEAAGVVGRRPCSYPTRPCPRLPPGYELQLGNARLPA